MSGRFLVVEGIDGAGTTTLSRALAQRLGALWTCEPSGGAVGRLIRAILRKEVALAPDAPDAHDAAMAMLFAADRREHLAVDVEPALAAGAWVVSDRYYHSTLAYQGARDDAAFESIRALHRGWARVPDLTLLLDVPVETAQGRRAGDSARALDEIYDAPDTQARVAARYRALAERLGEPIVAIDGTRDADAVLAEALAALAVVR
jgi:dTMP kinase